MRLRHLVTDQYLALRHDLRALLVKKKKTLTRYFGGSVRLRHLVTDQYLGTQFYLLYWYKSTNTDAIGGACSAAARVFDGACKRRGRMRTYADVC